MPHTVSACPVRTGPNAGKIVKREAFENLPDLYYQKRGWRADGLPPQEIEAEFAD